MKKIWQQLILTDKNYLSGESVLGIVENVIKIFKVRTVIVGDLVGAITGLRDFEGKELKSIEFLSKVKLAVQYDWAFFYMFENSVTIGFDQNDFKLSIQNADITVRLADNSYVYVYTQNAFAIKQLKSLYPESVLSEVEPSNLEVIF